MRNLDRKSLRRLIQLEMKSLMDEDALLPPPALGEPHYSNYHDYDDHGDDHECDPCRDKKMGIYNGKGGDCGCHESVNPYDAEREEDFGYDQNFDHDKHRHSSYMARPQLYKIAKYASELLDMVDEGEELQDWQESKIAQMSQMMGDVYHSIEYHEDYDDHDDMDVHDLIGMIRTGNI